MCEPTKTMTYDTTIKSNSTTKKYLTIQQTTLEQQTAVEQTNTEKQSTATEKNRFCESVYHHKKADNHWTFYHCKTVNVKRTKNSCDMASLIDIVCEYYDYQ